MHQIIIAFILIFFVPTAIIIHKIINHIIWEYKLRRAIRLKDNDTVWKIVEETLVKKNKSC